MCVNGIRLRVPLSHCPLSHSKQALSSRSRYAALGRVSRQLPVRKSIIRNRTLISLTK